MKKIWIEGQVHDVPECTCRQTPAASPHDLEVHTPECLYFRRLTEILGEAPEFLKTAVNS